MKKFLMLALVALMSVCAYAHTNGNKLFDNTAIEVKGGVSSVIHPTCNGYQNFGHTLEASAGLGLEKWVTPTFGVGLEGTVGFTNGSKTGFYQSKNWVNYLTVMAQAKVNVSNLICGYNGTPYKFEFIPTVGIGWVHGFYQGSEYGYPDVKGAPYAMDKNGIGTKFAVQVKYNVMPRLAITASPYIAYRFTNDGEVANRQPRFDINNSWYGLEIGVSYRVGKTFKVCNYKYTQAEMDAMNAKVNDLQAQLAKKPNTVEVEKVVTKTVLKKVNTNQYVVFFDCASAELSSEAKQTLDGIDATEVSLVQGSASPDGKAAKNAILASERADVVKNYLEGRGIKVNKTEGIGTTLNSRVTVVTVK